MISKKDAILRTKAEPKLKDWTKLETEIKEITEENKRTETQAKNGNNKAIKCCEILQVWIKLW